MARSPGSVLRAAAFALACCLLAVAGGAARAQQGDVRVQLGASSITVDESVRLAIVARGVEGELDTSALEREFDVVGRSSSRDVQILNGERRSTVTWVLELVPRSVGVFTVPAVSVGGVESELLTLTVTEAPTGAKRDVYVEASVDTRTPWVQSQVRLTLKVFRAIEIVDGALGEPAGDDLEVRALGGDRRYEEERDGRRYVVDERRYALFPQRSGELEIEPVTLSVTVPADPTRVRGFFSPTRKLVRRSAPIPLAVRPRPAGSGGWWLPASEVSLGERWRDGAGGDPFEGSGEVRVGEPLTRTLVLRADGVLDTQLPDLPTPDVDGLAVYADDPVGDGATTADGLEATRTVSFAIIPEREGTFELPAVTLDWFDVDTGRERTASLPARTLTVLPTDGGASAVPATPPLALAPAPDATGDPVAAGGGALPLPPADASPGDADGGSALVPPATGVAGSGADAGPAGGGSPPWRALAIAALVGWAATAAAFVHARRARRGGAAGERDRPSGRDPAEAGELRAARRRLEAAARDGDGPTLARAVLGRAALRWPADPPRSLAALAGRLSAGDPLVAELRALDASLYGRPDVAGTPAPAPGGGWASEVERALARAGPESVRHGAAAARDAAGLPPL